MTDAAYGHLLDGVQDPRDAFPQNVLIFDAGSTDYADRLAGHSEVVREATATTEGLDPQTTLLLLFTSGSTGAPKAVICSTGRWTYLIDRATFSWPQFPGKVARRCPLPIGVR